MLIGVISDTHRHHYEIEKAMEKLKNTDILIHLGDNVKDLKDISRLYEGSIINVKGNCDYSNFIASEKIEVIENKKIFITHGHNYDVKYGLLNLKYKALEVGADIVLYGHTHVSQITFEEGIYFVNPGSPALARDGFNSVATIEINGENIIPQIINV